MITRGNCRSVATGITARELDANTSGLGINITSSSSSYDSDAVAVVGGAGWLAESGNQGPKVCGKGGVAACSSEMLSPAETTELSAEGMVAILSDGK